MKLELVEGTDFIYCTELQDTSKTMSLEYLEEFIEQAKALGLTRWGTQTDHSVSETRFIAWRP